MLITLIMHRLIVLITLMTAMLLRLIMLRLIALIMHRQADYAQTDYADCDQMRTLRHTQTRSDIYRHLERR